MTARLGCLALAAVSLALAGPVSARGPWRASEGNTSGWNLMSPEERIEHQARIRGFKNDDDCRAYRSEHHALMAARARERGLQLPRQGRDFCEHLGPRIPDR